MKNITCSEISGIKHEHNHMSSCRSLINYFVSIKNYFLLLLLFLFALNSYSQIEKGNIIISLEGNYSNTSSENGVTTNLTETDGKYLEIGSSIGLFLSDRFVAGFGFDYN